ncbi:putative PEP-binding protein [Sinorhizobium sp. BG8]|uniref:putative PEP-binding protein n=1 Tax=Sinorhizobium sp. BG8 TaxID=2613773 RepID=UPI00193CB97B|nr:putative PEP-binding protein [Sinorhizobium sp. BG8]QRM54309.1 phosphoenolpyruvate--protein phosphotransferase [Sinorhizobium sp. BG8]
MSDTPRPAPFTIVGQGASPGLAGGLAFIATPVRQLQMNVPADQGVQVLSDAIATTVDALRDLSSRTDEESAAILEFQIEMLLDPVLVGPAMELIRKGGDPALAWVSVLDGHIRGFEESDDEQMRARAADLADIKNGVLRALSGEGWPDFPVGSVFVGSDIAPSLFLSHDWSGGGGIVLFKGSAVSHVAMLARSLAVPMVVGIGSTPISGGTPLLIDGSLGTVSSCPGSGEIARSSRESDTHVPPVSAGGRGPVFRKKAGLPVGIFANINAVSELDGIDIDAIDGVGLFRSEFLMATTADLANEQRQFEAYCTILRWAGDKPVTIRLLDFGGDKPLPGTLGGHAPPLLELRGVRLLLAMPEILRIQVRALLRAAAFGNLRVMVPMVTVPSELEAIRGVFEAEGNALERRAVIFRRPLIGMMVEVPAAALMLESFGMADFFSLGTNDLAQYLAAASRQDAEAAGLHAAIAPAVLRLAGQCVKTAARMGKPIAICGDMAGDPDRIPGLVAIGLRAFSMAPLRIASACLKIAELPASERMVAGGSDGA